MKKWWAILAFPAMLGAQSVHWGILGGTAIAKPYAPQIDEGIGLTPGVLGEVRLTEAWAVEANVLYRRQGYSGPFLVAPDRDDVVGGIASRSNVLDVPVMAKYRRALQDPAKLFVNAGYARRWRRESFRVSGVRGSDVEVPSFDPLRTTQGGFVVGGGVELDGGTMRLSLGYRFSRFGEFRNDKSHDLLVSFIF